MVKVEGGLEQAAKTPISKQKAPSSSVAMRLAARRVRWNEPVMAEGKGRSATGQPCLEVGLDACQLRLGGLTLLAPLGLDAHHLVDRRDQVLVDLLQRVDLDHSAVRLGGHTNRPFLQQL